VPDLVIITFAAFLASILQASTGMGGMIIFAPISFLVIGPLQALLLNGFGSLLGNLMILFTEKRDTTHLPKVVYPIALAALLFQAAAILVLRGLDPSEIKTVAGIMLILVALTQVPKITVKKRRPRLSAQVAVGGLAGASKTLVGVNGPFVAPYLLYLGLDKNQLRDTLTVLLLVMNALALPLLVIFLPESREAFSMLLPVLAATMVGQLIGRIFFKRMSSLVYRRLVIFVCSISALVLILA
jgi:uncharacterized membrane protein YfcA